MKNLLEPKSIAIVGASDKRSKIGNILIRNLQNKKYKGKIFPINPRHKIIEGLKVRTSVLEVDEKIDLAVIAIPADFVLLAIDECIRKGIKNLVIISAGFSESGKDGAKREEALKKLAKENGLNILGPNCLGFINVNKSINASFAKKNVPEGGTALISQSGAFVTALLDIAKEEQVGFSKIVTLGNKTVLDEVDFLKYLDKDPKTKAIALYLENIKKGREFFNAVSQVSARKPVLILKAGSSQKVQDAIMSHTGSMAGESVVVKKAFQESGALSFENIQELWQALKLFNKHPQPKNEKIVILTNAGGPGVVTSDLVEKTKNLDFYDFDSKEKEELRLELPMGASVENPIDILGDANSTRYKNILKILKKNKKIGAILALITPQAQTDVANILKVVTQAEKEAKIPIVPVFIGTKNPKTFQFPQELVGALDKIVGYQASAKAKKVNKKTPAKFNPLSSSRVRSYVEEALEEERIIFYYHEALELTRYYGINSLPAINVNNRKKPDFKKYKEVVMKVDDPRILHKMAQGGVRTGVRGRAQFENNLKQLRRKFKKEEIIWQKQVEKGTEIIIGLKKDPSFGPILLCGIGGILTEIFDEKLLWILPADKAQIKKDLEKSKIGKIFKKEGLDLSELVEEISKVGKIGWQNSWLKELDVNPMFFYPNKRPLAVDIKVKIDKQSNEKKVAA